MKQFTTCTYTDAQYIVFLPKQILTYERLLRIITNSGRLLESRTTKLAQTLGVPPLENGRHDLPITWVLPEQPEFWSSEYKGRPFRTRNDFYQSMMKINQELPGLKKLRVVAMPEDNAPQGHNGKPMPWHSKLGWANYRDMNPVDYFTIASMCVFKNGIYHTAVGKTVCMGVTASWFPIYNVDFEDPGIAALFASSAPENTAESFLLRAGVSADDNGVPLVPKLKRCAQFPVVQVVYNNTNPEVPLRKLTGLSSPHIITTASSPELLDMSNVPHAVFARITANPAAPTIVFATSQN